VNTDSAGRVIISHNKRWTEYPKSRGISTLTLKRGPAFLIKSTFSIFPVTEELLDEVLGAMSNRNEEDQARKTAMRAAILEVLYVQTSIISAAQRHQLGLSTTRRYCRDIKLRLEDFLGEAFVDNAFLRQFQKYKERVTLDHYKEALQRVGASGIGSNARVDFRPESGSRLT
jgi:hypothetical protein